MWGNRTTGLAHAHQRGRRLVVEVCLGALEVVVVSSWLAWVGDDRRLGDVAKEGSATTLAGSSCSNTLQFSRSKGIAESQKVGRRRVAKKRSVGGGEIGHSFGGDWTRAKLEVLAAYLRAYTTALKDKAFVTGYIDAFAGTPYRETRRDDAESSASTELLFPDLAEAAPQKYLDGSARLA